MKTTTNSPEAQPRRTLEVIECPQCACYKTEALNSKWRRCKWCRHVFERRYIVKEITCDHD